MPQQYKTVFMQAKIEIIEKKSRFIAIAFPVATEGDALEFLRGMKKKYWNASHNVYAYRVGIENEIRRYSDDGEPGGTAGMPVLDVLMGEDVKNVVINVTRYFGGTLLGAGGLVRAYSGAAKEALTAAGVIEMVNCIVIYAIVDYSLSGKVQYAAQRENYFIQRSDYTDVVKFTFIVESDRVNEFITMVTDLTGANIKIETHKSLYGYWREGQFNTKENIR